MTCLRVNDLLTLKHAFRLMLRTAIDEEGRTRHPKIFELILVVGGVESVQNRKLYK